jgi:hypothetical protein
MVHVPKPLSDTMLAVLRVGAVSSGLGGVSWTINGTPCGNAVYGLRNRGLITTMPVEIDGHKALMTVRTPAGEAALKENDNAP